MPDSGVSLESAAQIHVSYLPYSCIGWPGNNTSHSCWHSSILKTRRYYLRTSSITQVSILYYSDHAFRVTHHRRPWTEHLRCFVTGHRPSVNTWLGWFDTSAAYLGRKWTVLAQQIFGPKLCRVAFTSVTRHTLWTLGRNSTQEALNR